MALQCCVDFFHKRNMRKLKFQLKLGNRGIILQRYLEACLGFGLNRVQRSGGYRRMVKRKHKTLG